MVSRNGGPFHFPEFGASWGDIATLADDLFTLLDGLALNGDGMCQNKRAFHERAYPAWCFVTGLGGHKPFERSR